MTRGLYTTLIIAALLLGAACEKDSSGGNKTGDGGGSTNNAATNNGGGDFEAPPLDLLCAGLRSGDDVGEVPSFDTIACASPDPDNPCVTSGVQRRTRRTCFFVGEGGGSACGDDGASCIVRTLVDEQACPLSPPAGELAAGPWTECGPAGADLCATTGVRTRSVQLCRGGEIALDDESEPCERETEGFILEAEEPGEECVFDASNRCAIEGARPRMIRVCRGGAATDEVEEQPCARSTDGLREDDAVGACAPTDACGPEGAQDLAYRICVDGADTPIEETVVCALPAASADLTLTNANLTAAADYATIGAEDAPQSLTIGGGVTAGAVSLCRLARVFGDLTLSTGGGVPEIALDGLVSVGGTLTISATGDVALPSLTDVEGDLVLRGADAAAWSLPSLRRVGGSVRIEQTTGQTFELPRLAEVGGGVVVNNNAALVQARFPQLSEVGGELAITANPALQIIDLSAVAHVGGAFRVMGSPLFRTCDVYSFVSVIQTREGIDGTITVERTTDPRFRPAQPTTDQDADGIVEACDNCPGLTNINQTDGNMNGVGDDCE